MNQPNSDPVPWLLVNYRGDRVMVDACLTTPDEIDRIVRILTANRELLSAVSESPNHG